MWIPRIAEETLRRMARQFPAVLVTGPRQSGKTSLLRTRFPQAHYVSLDSPSLAESAKSNPTDFLQSLPRPAIIDEIQYAPSLFRSLKVEVDRDRQPGRFLLTGSQIFPLMQGVSESLAGRCGLLPLHTLSWTEAAAVSAGMKEEAFLFAGGFPELHAETGVERDFWYPAYVATYLERDVRNVLRIADLGTFNRFLQTCALRTGQVLSYSDLARDVGVAPNTARSWLSILTAAGTVFLVEPYHRNRGKRLVKSPKIFMGDTGLAAYLAGFRSIADLMASPLAGHFWETHVANQVWRHYAFRGMRPPLYYWRTPDGREVDLVLDEGGGMLSAIECKMKETPEMADTRGLTELRRFYGEKAVRRTFIACRTRARFVLPEKTVAISVGQLDQEL